MKHWQNLSLSQSIALAAITISVALTVVLAPEHLVEKLASTSPETIASWVALVGAAVVGVFVKARQS